MLALIPEPRREGRLEILCLGPHCDDIEIGCGATLRSLQRTHPGCRIHWAVACATPTRRAELERSRDAFVRSPARGQLLVGELPDGRLPGEFSRVKAFVEAVRERVTPDLIFTTHLPDRHQDHRLMAEVTWQTFRDHLILEYEIPKYEADLGTPNCYVPLDLRAAAKKARDIVRLYPSQRAKHWFTPSTFEALMRLRGIECCAPGGYAEAFHCRKMSLGTTARPHGPPARASATARLAGRRGRPRA